MTKMSLLKIVMCVALTAVVTACLRDIDYCYLSVIPANDTMGSTTGSGSYEKGSEVAICAKANVGYQFAYWSNGSTANPQHVVVTEDATYKAVFVQSTGFDENGASLALFSVSPDRRVRFSRGNLQYQASTGIWRFATHQGESIGSGNANISSSYDGWIDLFGWGTSGWDGSGANCFQPWSTTLIPSYYGPSSDIEGSNVNADWAYFNPIQNGGNIAGLWRTLSIDEWSYLFNYRADASNKYSVATIEGILQGIVLLPDDWIPPTGIPFKPGFSYYDGYFRNQYSYSAWEKMESHGAIFFPLTGFRAGNSFQGNSECNYWSSSEYDDGYAMYWNFDGINTISTDCYQQRNFGYAVRPVLCE